MTEEQWKAIETNDSSYDGKFCYALRTTHICCRPSCPVRACNPNNVIIFANAEEAMANGYRPCLRCHPELSEWKGAKNELAERAKKLIEKHYMDKFSLDEIAGKLFVNKSYLVRAFRETQKITPLHYHNLCRCRKAQELISDPHISITDIAFRTGFSSSSHFSRIFAETMGITPSAYRRRCLSAPNAVAAD